MYKSKISIVFVLFFSIISCKKEANDYVAFASKKNTKEVAVWQVPDTNLIPNDELGEAIRYGKKLLLNTAYYIGPDGIVSKNLGNKMNCTNCHLDAGTRPYALSFFSTHARYPQYRSRENKILSLAERVNNCIERPHSGKPIPLDSKEMIAIISYIKWIGQNVPVNTNVIGDSPLEIPLLKRAASSKNGEKVYDRDCIICHGKNGEGKLNDKKTTYQYPPLWGKDAYQEGSSMHRVVKATSFIYANMPYGLATYDRPKLTIDEAYDVAAFINDDSIHSRPKNNGSLNYPNIKTKPIDYGIGPFIDNFSEFQHKYGPYQPIINYRKSKKLPYKF